MKRLVVAVLLPLGACFGDLLVGPEPNIAPLLSVAVQARHDEQLRYVVEGFFRPGSDAEGQPRALLDSSLIVDGSSVQGVPTSGTSLRYEWDEVAAMPLAGDTITVRGPIVTGLPSSGLTLRLPVPVRLDPAFVEHSAGDDLLLNISPLTDTVAGLVPSFAQWQLVLTDARQNRRILILDGRGTHPSPLPVPWQLVRAAPGDSLTASVQLFSGHHALNTPYPVFVTIIASITWRLRIVAKPTA